MSFVQTGERVRSFHEARAGELVVLRADHAWRVFRKLNVPGLDEDYRPGNYHAWPSESDPSPEEKFQ